MRFRVVLTALFLIPTSAFAGDPCPIEFRFLDVGSPEWLDNGALLNALESKDSWVGLSFGNKGNRVVVRKVYDGSPAARSGLLKGDELAEIDGVPVTTHRMLAAAFAGARPGQTVKLAVTRGAEAIRIELVMGAQDPVIGAMIDHAAKQDCSEVRRANLTAAETVAIRAVVFSKQKRFQCTKAHRLFKSLAREGSLQEGDMVIVRGKRRMLFTTPGWATVCIKSADYDGARLTEDAIGKLFRKLTGRYVKDRHANP